LLALACHLGLLLLLDALPPAVGGTSGLTVRLQAAPPAKASLVAPEKVVAAAPLPAEPVAPPATQPAAATEPAAAHAANTVAPALAMARFFSANELDELAEPLQPIVLPETDDLPADVRLQVYIDASGHVVRVTVPTNLPEAYAEAIRLRFYAASFTPARKAGQAVASVKQIALDAEDL
jgi:hypothetical protein